MTGKARDRALQNAEMLKGIPGLPCHVLTGLPSKVPTSRFICFKSPSYSCRALSSDNVAYALFIRIASSWAESPVHHSRPQPASLQRPQLDCLTAERTRLWLHPDADEQLRKPSAALAITNCARRFALQGMTFAPYSDPSMQLMSIPMMSG